jgi:hypothetical protein
MSIGVVLFVRRAGSPAGSGPLIAVIIAIGVSKAADLASHGVAVVSSCRAAASLLPALGWHDATALLGAAASMFVVILAQARRPHAPTPEVRGGPVQRGHRPGRPGAANVAAAFSGTFVSTAARPRHRWPTARAGAARF